MAAPKGQIICCGSLTGASPLFEIPQPRRLLSGAVGKAKPLGLCLGSPQNPACLGRCTLGGHTSCAAGNGHGRGEMPLPRLPRAGRRWSQRRGRAGTVLCCWAATGPYWRERRREAGSSEPSLQRSRQRPCPSGSSPRCQVLQEIWMQQPELLGRRLRSKILLWPAGAKGQRSRHGSPPRDRCGAGAPAAASPKGLGGSRGATHLSPLSEPSGTGLPWMADLSMT